MNLPNKLTVSRFFLMGLFLWAMMVRSPLNDTLALVLFSLAGITDYLDGRIARTRNLITNFGILMDPLADKVMICAAFIAFIERHLVSPPPVVFEVLGFSFSPRVAAWMVVVIVTRELAITGLRLLAASKNVVLAAERYGKHKTISQMVAIISLLVMETYAHWWSWLYEFLSPWAPAFAMVAVWVTVVLTASSGVMYLWRNRELYLRDM
jgi:CDP-diacylglycerol---glycerol-3-phosphate 3-phosphatidyltransferase